MVYPKVPCPNNVKNWSETTFRAYLIEEREKCVVVRQAGKNQYIPNGCVLYKLKQRAMSPMESDTVTIKTYQWILDEKGLDDRWKP